MNTKDRHTTVVSTSETHRIFSIESEHRYKISYACLRFPSQEEPSIQSEWFGGHKASPQRKHGGGSRGPRMAGICQGHCGVAGGPAGSATSDLSGWSSETRHKVPLDRWLHLSWDDSGSWVGGGAGTGSSRQPPLSLALLDFCDFRNVERVARRHGLLL